MKLQAGVKKVVLADEAAARENNERYRNRGKIFKPVFSVWVISPNGERAVEHRCHTFKAKTLTPRTTVADFPFKWASTELRDNVRCWFETEGEMDLQFHQPEDM